MTNNEKVTFLEAVTVFTLFSYFILGAFWDSKLTEKTANMEY